MKSFFDEKRPHGGLTYSEYLANWRAKMTSPVAGLDKDARKQLYYSRYNYERSQRVIDTYVPSRLLQEAARSIDRPQLWMLLSEDWCGDSAFALPILAAAASASDHVELRILARDENLDIMDLYLTNGGRSIPKLVAFSMSGEELFSWGPRPSALINLRNEWKEEGADARALSSRTIAWYEDGNWIEIESELAGLIGERVVVEGS